MRTAFTSPRAEALHLTRPHRDGEYRMPGPLLTSSLVLHQQHALFICPRKMSLYAQGHSMFLPYIYFGSHVDSPCPVRIQSTSKGSPFLPSVIQDLLAFLIALSLRTSASSNRAYFPVCKHSRSVPASMTFVRQSASCA